jgi:hypothetical protein
MLDEIGFKADSKEKADMANKEEWNLQFKKLRDCYSKEKADMANKEEWNLQFKKLRDCYGKHGHCELV